MKQVNIGGTKLSGPAVSMGCMRIGDMEVPEAEALVNRALELGINYFDHADIYGGGRCEELFGQILAGAPRLREQMIVQTKCGICQGYYDFSKAHILRSVDDSLKRLQTEYIDVLLLHRPDTLMEPKEINEAFEQLKAAGKVRYFGVSNQNPMQMELLRKYVEQPLIINQLQLSVASAGMITAGMNVNMTNGESFMHDGSVLEYCRLHDITIQAWSPFQYGFFEGVFLNHEKFPELNAVLERIARDKGVTPTGVAVAWILRHPANMQVVTGSVNPRRLDEIARGADIELTRREWYEIYTSAGHSLP